MDLSEPSLSERSLAALTLPEPLELPGNEFPRVAIVGLGLIGGSIGLRMKTLGHAGVIVGLDRPEVLDEALERGAIDRAASDLEQAVTDADLIVLATPIDETQRLLPAAWKLAPPGAVITDTAPVKSPLAQMARETLSPVRSDVVYIGGHPLAGSSRVGIANADAALFENAYWLLTPLADTPLSTVESLSWWVRLLGAYPLILEAEQHDRTVAMTSHVPFLLAVTLSYWISQQSAEAPALARLATGNFQTMTALATLPLSAWEAVLTANAKEFSEAIDGFRKVLDMAAEEWRAGRFAEIWQQAHTFQRKLARTRPGDWDANCELIVTVADRPGTIARIAGLLASHEINICDVSVLYVRERRGGTIRVILGTRAEARRAHDLLLQHGYSARLKD